MRIRAALVALPLLVALAACGAKSTTATTGTASSGAVASSAGGTAASAAPGTPLGPQVPAATAIAPAVAKTMLPTATGKFGQKPTITFPTGNPVNSLQREILVDGSGAVTAKDDYLVTNYLGVVWGGTKPFDNSYDRKATSTFQIGARKVVPGWDTTLVGLKVGTRVLLSLPPSDGYGSTGKAPDIKGTDTLVFVVDIVGKIAPNATGQADAVVQPVVKGIPQVTGAPGKEPKIVLPKGLVEPKTTGIHVLAKGTGAKVVAGSILCQLVVTDWTESQTQSTWPKTGAAAAAADPASTGLQSIQVTVDGALKGLIGQPLGSRVMVIIPATAASASGSASPTAIAVLDLVAQA